MRWRWLAWGLAFYGLALLVMAPASFLDRGLDGASGGRLRLVEAQGRLWSGAGRLEMRAASGRALVSQGLRWHWLPENLLRAKLGFELELEFAEQAFVLSMNLRQLEVTNAAINLPAAALAAAQPKLLPLQLKGDVVLRIKSMEITPTGWTGNATLHWRHAGSMLTQVSPLGEYELQIAGEGTATRVDLVTLQGPLQLQGKGSLIHGGKLSFVATASIPQEFRTSLEPLMRLLAVERRDGIFEFQLG